MHLQLGEISLIVFSSADAAKEVLKTHDLAMANRPELLAVKIIGYGSTDVIFAPYGQYWRQLRKICVLELLTVKRVQSYRSIREELVGDLIAFISSSSGRTVNLSEKLFKLTNDITSRVAFGKKCKDGDVFIAEITKGIEMSSGFDVHDVFPSLKFLHWISGVKPALEEIHRKMDKILEDIINEHKEEMASSSRVKSGKEDLVDVLLKAQERGDLEVPFGAGRRMCPGVLFGSANIELPLAQLLYHFDWKLAHGTKPEDLDMTEVFGATLSEGVEKTSVFGAWRRRQQPPSQLNPRSNA